MNQPQYKGKYHDFNMHIFINVHIRKQKNNRDMGI